MGRTVEGERTKQIVFDSICDFWRTNYHSPSLNDLAVKLCHSTSHIKYVVDKLVEDGMIVRAGFNRNRNLIPEWVIDCIDEVDR